MKPTHPALPSPRERLPIPAQRPTLRELLPTAALPTLLLLAAGCAAGPEIEHAGPPQSALDEDAYVVDVVAEDFAFQAPDAVPSGWVTFRMENAGEETHFIFLTRLPEDRTYDAYVQEVGRPIDEILSEMRAGTMDKAAAGQALGGAIPAWYWTSAVSMGGPGLVAPGGVSQATVRLDPGTYVMECYMKTADGTLHWVEGMIRPLTVTTEDTGAPEPTADLEILVGTDAFEVVGTPTAGTRTVAVRYVDQPDLGFGNDIHLARLPEGMEATELVPWMDFLNVEGMQNPAPAPFHGGVHERPEGQVAYFTVLLEPGRYAWISESPDTKQMVQAFTVR